MATKKFWLSDVIPVDCLLQTAELAAEVMSEVRSTLPIGDGKRETLRALSVQLREAIDNVREARE